MTEQTTEGVLRGCRDMLRESAKMHRLAGEWAGHGAMCDLHADAVDRLLDTAPVGQPAGHTPGPWHVNPKPPENRVSEHGDDPYSIASGDHRLIARICVQGGQTADNAALIAAAPGMLVALRELTAERRDDGCHGHLEETYGLQLADAAIAEAEDTESQP